MQLLTLQCKTQLILSFQVPHDIFVVKVTPSEDVPKKDSALVLPLIDEKPDARKKESCAFKLLADPADAASAKHTFTVNEVDGSETVRQMIQFKADLEKVLFGTGAGAAIANTMATSKRLMKHTALTQHVTGAETARTARWVAAQNAARDAFAAANAGATAAQIEAHIAAVAQPAFVEADHDMGIQSLIMCVCPPKVL